MIRFAVFAPLCCLLLSSCQTGPVPPAIPLAIEAVRQEYAPDKRVALFQVTARGTADGVVLAGETNLPEARGALLRRLEEEGHPVLDSIAVLPAAALAGRTRGIVRLSAANIRSEPRHAAELATQATLGTPLRVYKEQDGWFLVQTPDEYLGWLDAAGFTAMTEAEYNDWMGSEKVVYLPETGFARAAADPGAPPVSDLLAGNILRRLSIAGAFTRVAYPDGREAFLPNTEVSTFDEWLASRQPTPGNILATARAFLGRPYLWGGTSGKGVDCSGFTKTVFFLNGLLLPRDASQQVHTGVEVPTDTTWQNLAPGDLLFFGRRAETGQPEKIVHVAIYLGEGRIIHASGSVCIESLRRGDPGFAENRFNTFVRAKRLLAEPGANGTPWLRDTPYYMIDVRR